MSLLRAATALLGAILLIPSPATASRPALTPAGPELRVNSDPEALRQHYDHTLAVNPIDESNYVVVNSHRWDSACYIHTSSDGGRSYSSRRMELAVGASRCGITSAAFDSEGRLYVAYNANVVVSGPTGSSTERRLFLARSDDGGRSFAVNKGLGLPSVFATAVAVDVSGGPRHGTVYIAYIPASRPPNRRATVVSSSDKGQTFSSPVVVAPITEQVTGRVQLDVGPDGQVYLAYLDFTEAFPQVGGVIIGATVFSSLPEDNPDLASMSAHVARSVDGGKTFVNVEVDTQLGGGVIANVQTVLPFPVVAVDPNDGNRAYLVVTDRRRNGDWDVYLYATKDGGVQWTPARRLNDDPLDQRRDQVMPWVDVAPNGRVDVVWLDRREDTQNRFARVYGTSSSDAGTTWAPNVPLSAVAFDSSVGSIGQGTTSYLGDRLAVRSAADGAYVVWPDSRGGNHDDGTNDLYARAFSVR